ncbi:MAG: hypothetical protein EA361_13765 [Bacteroidetes bacterium]|nr:MAG: hypothetical protein EA361_13765 [Bacteroidota bacterium]
MKHKKTHIIPTLKEIYDYIFRRKSNGNRHELERKMQQDPFVEEAMEGFTLVDESRAKQDIARLNEQIHSSTRKTAVYLYAGIAATVALLIIAGVGLLLMDQSQQSKRESQLTISEPSEPEEKRATTDEPDSAAPKDPAAETTEPARTITARQRETQTIVPMDSAPLIPAYEETEEFIVADHEISAMARNETDTGIRIPRPPIDTATSLAEALPESSGAATKLAETPMIILPYLDIPSPESTHQMLRGQVVDAHDWTPLPGVTITIKGSRQGTVTNLEGRFELEVPRDEQATIVASFIGMQTLELDAAELAQDNVLALEPDMASLSEVVVIGYGTSVRTGHEQDLHADDRMNRRDYSPPTPQGGYAAYRQYLRENAVLEESDELNRAVVSIRFTITPTGTTENFEIIRSPGEQYSQMAVDLIKSGPGWQAARLRGNYSAETVRFRIVFRKNSE